MRSWVQSQPVGKTLGEDEMRQFLETKHGNKPAKQTERNCVALIKQFCEGLVERVPHKPAKRFEAEQSLRATQSIAVGVVASSFLPGKPDVGGVADKNNKAAKMATTVVAVASNLQHTIVLCAAGMCMTSCENKE